MQPGAMRLQPVVMRLQRVAMLLQLRARVVAAWSTCGCSQAHAWLQVCRGGHRGVPEAMAVTDGREALLGVVRPVAPRRLALEAATLCAKTAPNSEQLKPYV